MASIWRGGVKVSNCIYGHGRRQGWCDFVQLADSLGLVPLQGACSGKKKPATRRAKWDSFRSDYQSKGGEVKDL
ncbi:uncharacterized protein PST29_4195 [Pseudomonas sp. St29]|nr:uncharacterized protein PST29_4195 [Pseudomonas sp. St29]